MYSVSLTQNKVYSAPKAVFATSPIETSPLQSANSASQISFGSSKSSVTSMRTKFSTQEEADKYLAVSSGLSIIDRRNLDILLKNGRLLNNESNDKSTTLDNLHKIISEPRAEGLDSKLVLKETVKTLANPFIINQTFGNIPKAYEKEILENAKPNTKAKENVIDKDSINVERSNSCVSASIEFNLAKQNPAEFARYAQGLTSPSISVETTIDLKNLTDKTLDSIWLLNHFNIPYKMHGYEKATITMAPDKNAIIRAKIQNDDKDYGERSLVDALMQATFMNVGSQQTYDSLTDKRGGEFSKENTGLIDFEKTFTESIVQNKNITSVLYQMADDDNVLLGYTTDFLNVQKHIEDSLKLGNPVITGYTVIDEDKKIVGGHEITILGQYKDKKGELYYICNDTDDGISAPIEYKAKDFVPMIHHAGIPQKVLEGDKKFKDTWVESLEAYQKQKKADAEQVEIKEAQKDV